MLHWTALTSVPVTGEELVSAAVVEPVNSIASPVQVLSASSSSPLKVSAALDAAEDARATMTLLLEKQTVLSKSLDQVSGPGRGASPGGQSPASRRTDRQTDRQTDGRYRRVFFCLLSSSIFRRPSPGWTSCARTSTTWTPWSGG